MIRSTTFQNVSRPENAVLQATNCYCRPQFADQMRGLERIMLEPAAALLAKPLAPPTHVAISDALDFLELTFPDLPPSDSAMAQGDAVRLSAPRLRAACRCAHCIRARIDGVFAQAFDGIAITHIAPIGDYAINIGFSDGHARGIYPWNLLLEIAAA